MIVKGLSWTATIEHVSDDVVVLELVHKESSPKRAQLPVRVVQLLNEGQRKILLNLSGVEYLESFDLGEIVSSYTITNRAGGTLKLCGVAPRISRSLELLRLKPLFEIFDSERDALNSFAVGEAGHH